MAIGANNSVELSGDLRPATDADLEALLANTQEIAPGDTQLTVETGAADEVEAALTGDTGLGDDLEDSFAASAKPSVPTEPEEGESVEETSEETAQKTETPTGRADARIQALATERNELRGELERTQQYFSQQMQQMQGRFEQQRQAQEAAQTRQLEIANRQLELAQGRKDQEDYSQMSLGDRLKYDTKRETLSEVERLVAGRISPLEQELMRERQTRAELEQKIQQQARYNKLAAQRDTARQNVILAGLDPADVAALSSETDEMLMAYSGGFSVYPQQAAPKFKKFLDRYAEAALKAKTKANKTKKVTQTQNIPAAPRAGGQVTAKGKARPSWQELQNKGMDYVDLIATDLMG